MKDWLKEQQPIVYQALEKAIVSNRSSAYLFSGPFGTPKKEAAFLFAKSFVCENGNPLACELCNTCQRIEEGEYADIIYVNGENGISKQEVDNIQENLSKTALEEGSGKKVYIITNFENASIAAQNSLLKFLEEPAADVIAILTTDSISKLLPTIISRCSIIPFLSQSTEIYEQMAQEEGIPKEDAYFLAHIVRNAKEMREVFESEAYDHGMKMFKEFLNLDGMRREELLIDYEVSWRFGDKEGKNKNLKLLQYFFSLVALYAKDAINYEDKGIAWYDKSIQECPLSSEQLAQMMIVAFEQRDLINKTFDMNLVLAQAMNRWEAMS